MAERTPSLPRARFARAEFPLLRPPILIVPDVRDQLQASLDGVYTIERELGGGMSRVKARDSLR
jgi:hypothetical protein